MTPLPRWTAPRMRPAAHSRSSRTSTRVRASPFSRRALTAATVVWRTRDLASPTSLKNPAECSTGVLYHLAALGRVVRVGREVLPEGPVADGGGVVELQLR